jgi:hypothetical protein
MARHWELPWGSRGLIEDEIGSALGVARPIETDVVDQI